MNKLLLDPEFKFGVYVHWPFCTSKCPYCDFNSHVSGSLDEAAWKSRFLSDIRAQRETIGSQSVQSVFFGGGTPSLMDPKTVFAVLEAIDDSWGLSSECEVTLEANPGSVDIGRFQGYRAAGVNRISIGVQALSDTCLRRLGRMHSKEDALNAIKIGKNIFDNLSFDLIYGRQDQTLTDWENELALAIKLSGNHLSLYQLTIEPETVFGRRASVGLLAGLPDEDLAVDLYSCTNEMTLAAGLCRYEVSNHARVGCESKHNLLYWENGRFAGIGPGAHGRLEMDGRRQRTEHVKNPRDYLMGIGPDITPLSNIEAAEEFIMMGLRLTKGFSLSGLVHYGFELGSLHDLVEFGYIKRNERFVSATVEGFLILDKLIEELINRLVPVHEE